MGELSPWHILIVVGVFVLLFGSKKLPDAARSLGRSMRILKTEIKDLRDDDKPAEHQRRGSGDSRASRSSRSRGGAVGTPSSLPLLSLLQHPLSSKLRWSPRRSQSRSAPAIKRLRRSSTSTRVAPVKMPPPRAGAPRNARQTAG